MEIEDELSFDMLGNVSEDPSNVEENLETDLDFSIEENDKDPIEENVSEDFELQEKEIEEEKQEEEKNTTSKDVDGSSPNLYTSIAKSLKEDGIFDSLDSTEIENIEDADALAELFNKQLSNMLDERQKRIESALSNEVPVDVVQYHEQVINYLDNISEDSLKEESKEAEKLRGQLIVQDFLNRGFSNERAEREAKKSFDAGTDIEDALDSLKECKEFYTNSYNNEIENRKKIKEEKVKAEKEESKKIEKLFLEVEEPIKGIKLTEAERKKVFNQYTKFIDKSEDNKPLNAIQKYAKENPVEYQYNINLLYYLTNGFNDLGNVIQKKVKTETKSSLSKLDKVLRTPSNNIGSGGIDFDLRGNDTSKDSFDIDIDFS
jgi:predicted RNase H-like HicB family nuclease